MIQHLLCNLSYEILERVMASPNYSTSISRDFCILQWTTIQQVVTNSLSNQPLEALVKWNSLKQVHYGKSTPLARYLNTFKSHLELLKDTKMPTEHQMTYKLLDSIDPNRFYFIVSRYNIPGIALPSFQELKSMLSAQDLVEQRKGTTSDAAAAMVVTTMKAYK